MHPSPLDRKVFERWRRPTAIEGGRPFEDLGVQENWWNITQIFYRKAYKRKPVGYWGFI
jgi:hypothetical protein